jgi:hypothetical protein
MKRLSALFLSIGVLAGFGFSQSSISNFSLRLSGGVSYFSVGELNSVMEGLSDYFYTADSNVSGRYESMHLGMNFSLEAVYLISDRLGIGLGGGFFRVSKEDKLHYEYANNTIRNDITYTRTIGVVPLTLNIHYLCPLGSKLNLSLSGGVGYYLTSFDFKGSNVEMRPTVTNHGTETADYKTKGTIGFQGSLGLDMPLTKNLGIFVAARGRYATVSGLRGELSADWVEDNLPGSYKESDIRFWVEDYHYNGNIYPDFVTRKDEPASGDIINNIHELKIDLSGFSLGVGLRINF